MPFIDCGGVEKNLIIITNYFLIEISYPEFPTTNELIKKLSKNCDDSRFITAPKNLLDFKVQKPFE